MKSESAATESHTLNNDNGSRLILHPSGQQEVQFRLQHTNLTFDPAHAPASAYYPFFTERDL